MKTCPDCQSVPVVQIVARVNSFQEPGTAPNETTTTLINMKMDELRGKGYVHDAETMSMVNQCADCRAADERTEETREDVAEMGSGES